MTSVWIYISFYVFYACFICVLLSLFMFCDFCVQRFPVYQPLCFRCALIYFHQSAHPSLAKPTHTCSFHLSCSWFSCQPQPMCSVQNWVVLCCFSCHSLVSTVSLLLPAGLLILLQSFGKFANQGLFWASHLMFVHQSQNNYKLSPFWNNHITPFFIYSLLFLFIIIVFIMCFFKSY